MAIRERDSNKITCLACQKKFLPLLGLQGPEWDKERCDRCDWEELDQRGMIKGLKQGEAYRVKLPYEEIKPTEASNMAIQSKLSELREFVKNGFKPPYLKG